MNNTTYVTLYDSTRTDEQPPTGLQDYIAWLQGYLAKVPDDLQASADLEHGYEGEFFLRYQRPATPEEMAKRHAMATARGKAQAAARKARKLWEERLAEQMRAAAAANPAK